MGKYSEYIHKLPEDRQIMEALTTITDEFVESVKNTLPQRYANLMSRLKALSENGHFTKEKLEAANNGWHWTVQDTTAYAKEAYDIDFDKESFNEYDLNFIMNEMYRNFYSIYQEDVAKYAELSLAWLDKNNGKAYAYYEKLYC